MQKVKSGNRVPGWSAVFIFKQMPEKSRVDGAQVLGVNHSKRWKIWISNHGDSNGKPFCYLKNAYQFIDNKKEESVENQAHVHPKGTCQCIRKINK